jgi:hypothetical protein
MRSLSTDEDEDDADPDTTLALADEVIAELHVGLRALEDTHQLGAEPPEGHVAVNTKLNGYLLQAAKSAIVAMLNQLTHWQNTGMYVQGAAVALPEAHSGASTSAARPAAGPSRPRAGAQPPSREALITLGLDKLAAARQRLAAYEQIVDAFPPPQTQFGPGDPLHAVARLSKVVAQSVTRDINGLAVELHMDRLETLGTSFDSIAERMNARSIHAIADTPAVYEAWDAIDGAQELGPKQLASAKLVASAYLDGIDALSEQLCIDAAARIDANDDSALWRYTLDTASAFQTYASFLRQVRDQARAGAPAPSAPSPPPAASTDIPTNEATIAAEAAPGASAADAQPQRETATTSQARPRAGAVETTAPTRQPTAQPIQRPRYRELVERANGDLASMARALGKDATTLVQLRNPAFDPIESAQYARHAVQSWLGDIDNLRKAVRRASTGPSDSSAHSARLDLLTDRLDALTLVHHQIATAESDALKALSCPKAKHVRRLLKLNELAHVGAPVRLPSAGDVGDQGTLFEMTILLKPLSSGAAARPLFVHLHTAERMDAASAGTTPFRKLTAAHVKTEAQRRLGARWEQMANALGSVHRGKIDSALLGELRAFSRAG